MNQPQATEEKTHPRPLDGIRIVDFTWVRAGALGHAMVGRAWRRGDKGGVAPEGVRTGRGGPPERRPALSRA